MLHDFLPALFTVAFLAAVVLFGWLSDVRRIAALNRPAEEPAATAATLPADQLEPL